MTRAEYNEILRLHDFGLTYRKACKKLSVSYYLFINTLYRGDKCKDDDGYKGHFKWTKEKNNELLQLMSDNNLNFKEAFRIFGKNNNISELAANLHWYTVLKKQTKESICESTGRGLTTKNVKNAFKRCPVKQKFIKETTNEMRELHNIPIFDSTISFSFKYIYK